MARQRKRGIRGAGSVFLRKDGRWEAKFKVEETGKYKSLYASTEKEAYKMLQDALLQQKQGILATGPDQTVKQFLEYWLEDVYKVYARLTTFRNARILVHKHLIPGLGHFKLQKLTTQQVQSFYAKKLREGATFSRLRNINGALHTALEHARRAKLVSINVCDDIRLPAREEPDRQFLTSEQAHLLLQKVKEHQLEMILILALATGMREGELVGLRWSDVDLEAGMLRINRTVTYVTGHGNVEGEPKTAKGKRNIMLPPFVVVALKHHYTMQEKGRLEFGSTWIARDLVFPEKNGDFIVANTLLRRFHRLLKEIGLPRMRFHDLRHSTATLLLSMGVPLKVVQELLGHSSIDITANIYSHVLPSVHKDAMDKMGKFLDDGIS
jgi:integrase